MNLYKNLGKNFKMFHLLLPIFLSAINQQPEDLPDLINTEYEDRKQLLRAGYSVMYIILDVSVIFRAEMREPTTIGKRFGLLKNKVTIHEAFKFIVGTKDDKPNGLWSQTKGIIDKYSPEASKEIDKAISVFKGLYWRKENKKYRDIPEHFSNEPEQFYDLLLTISEEDEAAKLISLLAILEPM